MYEATLLIHFFKKARCPRHRPLEPFCLESGLLILLDFLKQKSAAAHGRRQETKYLTAWSSMQSQSLAANRQMLNQNRMMSQRVMPCVCMQACAWSLNLKMAIIATGKETQNEGQRVSLLMVNIP